ncbi:alpha/beta hydrolase [Cobetia crustatorum]|uniref:alpha/beta hydrolase n=1 Tax=Cobetia crustatorum TaxID=553385 RepID=UPI0009FBC758|nr:alpha/beta fold hydrolase [Cobetia crustatorum]
MPEKSDHAFDFTTFLADKATWSIPASLEPYTCRDGSSLGCRHYSAMKVSEASQLCDERHIILIHGSSSDSRYLATLATQLATVGYHIHTPDLRGHGPAPARRGDIDHSQQLEEDIEDLITSLALSKKATLLIAGHSAGGGLALRFAADILRRQPLDISLAGVILLAPYLHYRAPNTRHDSTWATPNIPRMLLCSLLAGLGIHACDHLEVLTFNIPKQYRDSNTTSAYSWRMMQGINPQHYQRDLAMLAQHGVPLLAMIGEHDEAFHAERLGNSLLPFHEKTQLEVMDNVDHLGIATSEMTGKCIDKWLTS